nr:unnamed protein product [Callosobruchus analis]
MLKDTGCLTLPHPIYLSQITADIGIKQSQIQYLKRNADNLAPHEKFINILFDEIHIAPKVEYRGEVLRGLTEKNEVANKIQAFMLSVFSKNEDIIALYPVKKNSSEMLKKMTLDIIKILTDWKIVNVRSSKAGIHLKDSLREPIISPDHYSIKFLRKLIQFLNAWEKLDVPQYCPEHTGKLTKDTFTSLKYTSAAFIDLVDYLFTVNLNLHFELKYGLLGKFQTDKMEEYEHKFVNAPSQQKIFKKLALVKAEDFVGQYPETCSRCDKPFKSIIIKIVHILDNYSKNLSDNSFRSNSDGPSEKSRKLLTFS